MENAIKAIIPQKKSSISIDRNLSSKIPFMRCYEEEGIIETTSGNFSKTYSIGEIDIEQISKTSQASARQVLQALMNSFPANVSYQFTTYNRLIDTDSYLKQILIIPNKEPELNDYIEEYDKVIVDNVSIGHNNIKKTTYFTVSVRTSIIDDAVDLLRELDIGIKERFGQFYGVVIKELTLMERLHLLYSMFNPGNEDFGKIIDIDVNGVFDIKNLKYMHLSIKDLVAPNGINHAAALKNHMILNPGTTTATYVRSFAITNVPRVVSDNVVSDLTNVSSSMIFSSIYESIDTMLGYETAKSAVVKNTVTKDVLKNDTVADRKAHIKIQHKEQKAYSEKDYFNNSALELFQKNVASSQTTLAVTFVVTIFGNYLEDINRDSALLKISADKFGFKIKTLDFQQLEGFQTCLPLCSPRIDLKRIIDLDRLVTMCPVSIQDVIRRGGVFNGLNAINDNLILLNRRNNKNLCGIIAGVEHSGKTYQNKKEIFNALISTNDDIAVITDSDEYDEFAERLGGQVITSMDIDIMMAVKGYGFQDREGNEENDLIFKSYFLDAFLMSICNTHKSRIEQEKVEAEVSKIIHSLDKEGAELFDGKNHFNELCSYVEDNRELFPAIYKLLKNVKCNFIGYGVPNSWFLGSNEGNANTRLTIYKARSLADILVIMDYLRNKTVLDLMGDENGKSKFKWLFIDPADMLLGNPSSADYLSEYMYKSDLMQTVVTLVLQDSVKLINSPVAIMAFEDVIRNSGYFKLLNQGPVERHKFIDLLAIPQALVPYISNVEPGKGIIITSSSNMAFDDNFLDKENKYHQLFAKDIEQIIIGEEYN